MFELHLRLQTQPNARLKMLSGRLRDECLNEHWFASLTHARTIPVKSITAKEAPAYFGWLAMFAGADMPASCALTRKKLGWNPTGPSLITDLDNMDNKI